jgi:hypothetical protein
LPRDQVVTHRQAADGESQQEENDEGGEEQQDVSTITRYPPTQEEGTQHM